MCGSLSFWNFWKGEEEVNDYFPRTCYVPGIVFYETDMPFFLGSLGPVPLFYKWRDRLADKGRPTQLERSELGPEHGADFCAFIFLLCFLKMGSFGLLWGFTTWPFGKKGLEAFTRVLLSCICVKGMEHFHICCSCLQDQPHSTNRNKLPP